MNWETLLTTLDQDGNKNSPGSRFSKDFTTLQFSPAFRALQDKTQVFSLVGDAYVRTRLTHTLEVSNVGRELGHRVGRVLVQRFQLQDMHRANIGSLVSAACLAHDLGHPPMAHAGESAIRQWMATSPVANNFAEFLTHRQHLEFLKYEGNAQNYRLVQTFPQKLSYACLAVFSKYLCPADFEVKGKDASYIGFKKYGYFDSEAGLISDMANAVGLPEVQPGVWLRHPLAYLTEAADDICYRLADMEDFHHMNIGDRSEVMDLLRAVAGPDINFVAGSTPQSRVEQMRAAAIERIVDQAVDVFLENEEKIREGSFSGDILDHIPDSAGMRALTTYAKTNVYNHETVISTRLAGFTMLAGLLDFYGSALWDAYQSGQTGTPMRDSSRMAIRLIPAQYATVDVKTLSPYALLHLLLDFIGGLTDSAAVDLFKRVKGQTL
jgi:dGTPase